MCCGFHSGAFLRVAPEHADDTVLALMRKPDFSVFVQFLALFREVSKKLPRPIGLALYWIIGFPGETEEAVRQMRETLSANRLEATDVQLFTPIPGTLATAMWVAGRDLDGRPLAVERDVKKLEARKALLTGG
jgi:tRNA A37 methylthiotransferase MiaB